MEERPGIKVRAEGAVRIVTLDRPEALNAVTEDLLEQLVGLWDDVEDDPDCRAIVLTGAGRAFSAGGSYDEFEARRVDLAVRRRSLRNGRRLIERMIDVAVPVVAAVNGPAVGLGATMTTLCDVVFISEDAFLADTHVAVALVAGDGGTLTWPAHTSLLRAKQYLLTGDRLSAAEAVEIGLANFVVPAVRLQAEALAFAHRLAERPPQAVQETKALLNQHLRANAVRVLGYGFAAEGASHDMPEYREAAERIRPRER